MHEPSSDAELIAAQDPEAFGIVFDRHFETIHRYLERRIGRDRADELSAEVFAIAFEQRGRFRPLYESALPWLYGLATKLVLKHWRSEVRHLRALARLEGGWNGGDPGLDSADDRVMAQLARGPLLDALACLRERDRDVLVLVAWEELSYDEVAAALDIPAGTVRSRLNRARRSLRELLAESESGRVSVNVDSGGLVRDDR